MPDHTSSTESAGSWPDQYISCQTNFPEIHLPYVAGHPDRFLFGKSFQPVLIRHINPKDPWGWVRPGDKKARTDDIENAMARAQVAVEKYEQAAEKLFGQESSDKSLPFRKVVQQMGMQGISPGRKPPFDAGGHPGKPPVSYVPIANLLGKVGVLYYDRIRLRNMGTVVGKHLTTLSLAPGEEVTFNQRSETVLSQSLEQSELLEQETERKLSSTFSTDWGSQLARSSSLQVGGNLGVDASFQIPKVDFLNIGGNVGGNINHTQTESRTTQTNFAFQLVQDIGRRSRQEHKTVINISSDQTTAFQSNRRIVNDNPLRNLILKFHKIYNKERVSLERYDAKLAISVCLVDPLTDLILGVQDALDQLDPHNPANYNCTPPRPGTTETPEDSFGFADPIVPAFGPVNGVWVDANPADSSLVYSHHDEPVLLEWKVKKVESDFSITEYSADTSQFVENGGFLRHPVDGPPGGTPATRKINVWSIPPKSSFFATKFIPGSWWTSSLRFRIAIHFIPNPTEHSDYKQCMDSERERLTNELSPERIDTIIGSALRPVEQHVFQTAIASCFGDAFADLGDNVNDFLIKHFRHYFDWNEAIIELLPSWMSGHEDLLYEDFREKLSTLLPGYDPSHLLPRRFFASGAQVIIPISPGYEQEVLDLLSNDRLSTEKFVTDFLTDRESRYGATDRTLPDHLEILSPQCVSSTPDCSDDWQQPWEQSPRKFEVLNVWSEYSPTDGVHAEPLVGGCVAVDEARHHELQRDLVITASTDSRTEPQAGHSET